MAAHNPVHHVTKASAVMEFNTLHEKILLSYNEVLFGKLYKNEYVILSGIDMISSSIMNNFRVLAMVGESQNDAIYKRIFLEES